MARPKLRRPDQPWWLQLPLGLFEAAASLKLAVAVISASAVVLAWATFVEKWYGTEAVSFGIYQSWWFALLLALLGLNVLSAALIRFPWKKYQTGFVITHAGILVLLAGCLVQRVWGVHAHMVIYEGEAESLVFEDQKLFRLAVSRPGAAGAEGKPEEIDVPFRSGPFNWDDYGRLSFFPWRLAPRDRGLVYGQDGIALEVLDYYADSTRVPVPRLVLDVTPGAGSPHAGMGLGGEASRLALSVEAGGGPHAPRRPAGVGARKETPLGPNVLFWMAGSEAERRAILECLPEGTVGTLGQIVLWHEGHSFRFGVEELQQAPEQTLGETGLKLRFVHHDPRFHGVRIEVRRGQSSPVPMSLHAHSPYFNEHAEALGVYGAYWAEPPEAPPSLASDPRVLALRMAAASRLDVVLGRGGKLYYREWQAPRVVAAGPWPAGGAGAEGPVGSALDAFRNTPVAMEFRVAEFRPAEAPAVLIEPKPFEREDRSGMKEPRARVRLTVDGNSGEFWVPLGGPRSRDEQAAVVGTDRRVEVVFTQSTFELSMQIFLRDFKRKVDPGSPHDSHYSSLVDVMDRAPGPGRKGDRGDAKPDPVVRQSKALITMNQPLSALDPASGRMYRFYQSSFAYVGKPGERDFDQRVYGDNPFFKPAPKEDLYRSVLSLNYDPGRGLKYAGSLLIVAGIATMFYMRAYFFARHETKVIP